MVLSVIKEIMLQFLKEILNLKGHPNGITGSKVTAILLNGWALPIGGASAVKGLQPAQQACFKLITRSLLFLYIFCFTSYSNL